MGIFEKLFGRHQPSHEVSALSDATSLGKKLAHLRRTTWFPTIREGDCARNGSKFSGIAFIPSGESWPTCGNCAKPMQLFLQLNAADVPAEAKHLLADGILQLFYCTNTEPLCEVDADAFFGFSKAHLARVIPDGDHETLTTSPVDGAYPAKSIIDWSSQTDVPNWEEAAQLGVDLSDEESDELADTTIPEIGEKLGGWPAWIQGVEYPLCPRCNQPMHFLFQLDSDQNLPHWFGDMGIGHITQCENHPEVLTFGWACG